MDQVTQQNAALVEESAAAAASLKEQAITLAEVVAVFKLSHQETQRVIARAQVQHSPASATRRPLARPSTVATRSASASGAKPSAKTRDGSTGQWEEF